MANPESEFRRPLEATASSQDVPAPSSSVADLMFLQPSILDQMHDAVIVTDLHGVVQGCNRAVSDLYGYTPEELRGQSTEMLYPEEMRELPREKILPHVLAHGEFRGEVQHRTRTGEYVFTHLSVTLLRDQDGEAVGMVTFAVNVTSQKLGRLAMQRSGDMERERDALQESSDHMRLLFDAVERAEDVVLITEAEPVEEPGPRILYVNRAFERMTGYTCHEVLGRSPRLLQGPKSDRATLDRIRAALKAWKPVREQLLNYRKDGSEFYVDLSIFPIADEKGWFTHWIAIQRDVTDQHAVQERLRESEERYRILTEAIPQLVWSAKPDGTKIFCNQRYFDYTGTETLFELGSSWMNYLHPDDREGTVSAWNQALASGEPYSCEYRLRRKDGVYRRFLARATPLRTAEGAIERWLGSSTDVEDQKASEAGLRKAEKLATAGRLASNLAHEINNPLSAAINSMYLVGLDRGLGEESRAYLRQAEAELARVAHVTTQTLGFFKQSTAPTSCSMAAVMDSALSLFAGRMEAHGVELARKYSPCAEVFCCRDEIRQVFANLVSNALDAMQSQGRLMVHIRHALLWDEERTPGVRIAVGENGSGIPAPLRDEVFDAFMSTKDATGTGLGLWVVQDLVHKHKGRVRFRSSTDPVHHGTVFSLFLPYRGLA